MLWNRILLGLIILLNLLFLYRIVLSDQGIFGYLELRKRNGDLERRIEELQQKTVLLSDEIRLLQSDSGYIEKMIREQMNLVRENEVLYDFSVATDEDLTGAGPDEEQN